MEIDLHFVRGHVALGHVCVLHVPSANQYAYIFTNGLPIHFFLDFRNSLNFREPHVSNYECVLDSYVCYIYECVV